MVIWAAVPPKSPPPCGNPPSSLPPGQARRGRNRFVDSVWRDFGDMLLIMPLLLLALVLSGAGQAAGVLPAVALLGLAWLALLTRPQPSMRSLPLIVVGLALFCTLLLTLVPLPVDLLGNLRAGFFHRGGQVFEAFAQLGVDTLAGDGQTMVDETLWRRGWRLLSGVEGQPTQVDVDPGPVEELPAEIAEQWRPRARHGGGRLTLNRSGTIRTLFLLAGCWVFFWATAGASGRQRRRLLSILVLGGAGVAMLGMLGKLVFPQGKMVLWLLEVDHGQPIGPFVNRNHFAFFCALLVPTAMALLVSPGSPREAGRRPGRWRQWGGGMAMRLALMGSVAVLAAGVAVSLSRSGLLVLVAGLTTWVVLMLKDKRLAGGLALLLAVGVGAGLRYLPMEEFHDRMATLREPLATDSAQTRFQVWGDCVRMWRAFPVFGCGADALRVVYPFYKQSPSRKGAIHAENEYFQLLADNGLVGMVLLGLLAVAFCWWAGRQSAAAGDDTTQVDLRRIAVATAVAAGVHAGFDFGLRMPLNAFLLAAILGCGGPSGQVADASHEPGDDSRTATTGSAVRLVSGLVLLVLLPLLNVGWLAAWRLDRYQVLQRAEIPTLTKAIQWAPTYWVAWHETGRRSLAIANLMQAKGDERAAEMARMGDFCLWYAAELNPTDYRVWSTAAESAWQAGDRQRANQAARRVVALRPYLSGAMSRYFDDAADF